MGTFSRFRKNRSPCKTANDVWWLLYYLTMTRGWRRTVTIPATTSQYMGTQPKLEQSSRTSTARGRYCSLALRRDTWVTLGRICRSLAECRCGLGWVVGLRVCRVEVWRRRIPLKLCRPQPLDLNSPNPKAYTPRTKAKPHSLNHPAPQSPGPSFSLVQQRRPQGPQNVSKHELRVQG